MKRNQFQCSDSTMTSSSILVRLLLFVLLKSKITINLISTSQCCNARTSISVYSVNCTNSYTQIVPFRRLNQIMWKKDGQNTVYHKVICVCFFLYLSLWSLHLLVLLHSTFQSYIRSRSFLHPVLIK